MADDETLPDEGIASSAARNINKLAIIFFSGFFNLFFFLCRYEDRCVSLEGSPATEHVQTAVLCFLNLFSALPALVDKQKRKKATKKEKHVRRKGTREVLQYHFLGRQCRTSLKKRIPYFSRSQTPLRSHSSSSKFRRNMSARHPKSATTCDIFNDLQVKIRNLFTFCVPD